MLLKYVKKQIFTEYRNTILLFLLFGLTAAYPLYNYEALQNRAYLIVFPSKVPVNRGALGQLENIKGVFFVSAMAGKQINESYLIEVDNNFRIFAKKFLSEGILPNNKSSVVYVDRSNNNHGKHIDVGDSVEINMTTYKVVGILQATNELGVALSGYYGDNIFIRFTENLNNFKELIVSAFLFANFTYISEKIKGVLGNNTFVYTPGITPAEIIQEIVYLSGSLVSWITVTFLLILWLRENSVVQLAVGWRKKYIIFEILTVFLMLTGIGNLFCYSLLYFLTSFQSKYYFYTFIPLLFSFISTVFSMIAAYVYTEIFVIRKAVEVLTK